MYKRLNLPKGLVDPTSCTFHDIVPGRKAYPIGKVMLPVTFGSPSNYYTEMIQFELVNFNSPYHCVLGRQEFAKFMAVPHYAYNAMKIPGPASIITVRDDPDLAIECEDTSTAMADAVIMEEMDHSQELAKYATPMTIPS